MKMMPSLSVSVLGVVSFFFLVGCGSTFDVSIPKEKVISKVQSKFPVNKQKGIGTITLSNPELEFNGSKNRIEVVLDLKVSTLGLFPIEGNVSLDGTLDYKPEEKKIYLGDIKVHQLDIKELPQDKFGTIKDIVTQVLVPLLGSVEVYEFDASSTSEKLASATLKKITIKDDSLVATIGY